MLVRKTGLALLATAMLAVPAVAQEGDLTADQIVAKNLEARGGLEKIQAVETVKINGKMMMQGMEVPITLLWTRPDKVRMEMTVQGQTGIQAYDGTTAWMYMPFMGKTEPETMPAEAVDDMQEMADFDGALVNYQEKGHTVELLGEEEIEGTPAYKLKLTKKNGDETVIYIDADHFLEIRQEAKRKMGDQEVETATTIGNFKQVDGLVLPHSMEIQAKGAPAGAPGQSIVIDSYEIGAEIPADAFAMPEKAPAAGGGR